MDGRLVIPVMKMAKILVASIAVVLLMESCKKDKVQNVQCDGSNPTYTGQIRAIINANCTSSNCHPGFTTYAGLEGALQNGSFEREVLTNQTMPRNGSLSASELSKIRCWVDNGFPEN